MLHAEWAKLRHMHACGMHTWAAGLATTMAFVGWRTACAAAATGANPATHAGGENKGWQVVELVKECVAKCGAHTSRGCCDGAPVHPTMREPGTAMACEHARAKMAQPVTRWRAWCIGQLHAPHSMAKPAPHSAAARSRPREVRGGGDRSPRSSGASRAAALPQRPVRHGVEPATAARRGALGPGSASGSGCNEP